MVRWVISALLSGSRYAANCIGMRIAKGKSAANKILYGNSANRLQGIRHVSDSSRCDEMRREWPIAIHRSSPCIWVLISQMQMRTTKQLRKNFKFQIDANCLNIFGYEFRCFLLINIDLMIFGRSSGVYFRVSVRACVRSASSVDVRNGKTNKLVLWVNRRTDCWTHKVEKNLISTVTRNGND